MHLICVLRRLVVVLDLLRVGVVTLRYVCSLCYRCYVPVRTFVLLVETFVCRIAVWWLLPVLRTIAVAVHSVPRLLQYVLRCRSFGAVHYLVDTVTWCLLRWVFPIRCRYAWYSCVLRVYFLE